MKHWILMILAAAPAASCAWRKPASAPTAAAASSRPAPNDPRLEALAHELEPKVERLRGLKFKEPVAMRACTRDEYQARLLREFDREMTPDDVVVMSALGELTGMLKPGFDVRGAMIRLATATIAGEYVPKEKTLYVLEDVIGTDEFRETLVHELCHALDDQTFDLAGAIDTFEKCEPTEDDRAFAYFSVVEGIATCVEARFTEDEFESKIGALIAAAGEDADSAMEPADAMDDDEADAAVADDAASDEGNADGDDTYSRAVREILAAPPILTRMMLERYRAGRIFLNHHQPMDPGGGGPWADGANRAMQSPPASSEQVMHPEKYWDSSKTDAPRSVRLPDLTNTFGQDWRRAGGGVLGEIGVAIWTTPAEDQVASIDHDESEPVPTSPEASGWAGDRYDCYVGPGGAACIVWASAWDSPDDAKEMSLGVPHGEGVAVARRVEGDRLFIVLSRGVARPGAADAALDRLAKQSIFSDALRTLPKR